MGAWSVALFGHDKPDYYYLDKETGLRTAEFVGEPTRKILSNEKLHVCTGNEKRVKPGDIVAFMPTDHKWGKEEIKGFLIIEVEGLTRNQMEALCEPYWDLMSVLTVEEATEKFIMSWQIYRPEESYTQDDLAEFIANYPGIGFPSEYSHKRRFNIQMSDLENWGIDIEKMKDRDLSYVPRFGVIDYKQCFDKLRNRKILKTDGLNMIKSIYE